MQASAVGLQPDSTGGKPTFQDLMRCWCWHTCGALVSACSMIWNVCLHTRPCCVRWRAWMSLLNWTGGRPCLGGPNGLLPLAHQSRAATESFGKSEIPGPERFCDLCQKLPRHGNSNHLMSFKQGVFCATHFCDLWSCAGTEIISEAPFFDFLIF